jgi:hypothetical protein
VIPRRSRRLAFAVLVVILLGVALLALVWLRRPSLPAGALYDEPPIEAELPGRLLPVEGNPGWESLPAEERERAGTPMTDAARDWLRLHRTEVLAVARAFDVSPVALGGIVAAEETLLVGRMDAVGERLFLTVFRALREQDLERWVVDQERAYQREARAGQALERDRVRTPYLWTLGPAQVSFRLAVRIEPQVAATMDRPRRDVKQVLEALTTVPGSLEYAAALLAQSHGAYARIAGLDIGDNPGVLATLYHVGAPTVRARRLAIGQVPHVNFYGAWVNLHAAEVAELLEVPAPAGAEVPASPSAGP